MPSKFRKSYVCYYDGQQEKMYFEHFAKLIKENFSNSTVDFEEVKKLKVLSKLSTNIPKIAVFDYDNKPKEFECKVKTNGVEPIYTSLNFDLWLLLHKKKFSKSILNNDDYQAEIRKEFGLGDTDNIKKYENIKKILNQINLEDIERAIKNANEIMNAKLEDDKIKIIKGKKPFYYYDNPSMNIHNFFEKLLRKIAKNGAKDGR